MLELLNSNGLIVIILAVLGYLGFNKLKGGQLDSLKSALLSAKNKNTDAVLTSKQEELEEKIKKAQAEFEAEKEVPHTLEEVAKKLDDV